MATVRASVVPPSHGSGAVRHFDADDPPAPHEDAVWKSSYINALPDSAFLFIEPGGTKDEHGRTDSAHRHFPYKDDTGAVDMVHVRDAIGRIPQSNVPPGVKARLQEKAKALLGSSASHNDTAHFDGSKMRRTPQGGLRGPATPTKVGVFKYKHNDGPMAGKIVREYRPAEEVFRADSLATLEQAPLTDFHPSVGGKGVFVTTENFTQFSKGQVADVSHNDTHVTCDVIAQEKTLVADILAGRRIEASCGYVCKYDWTPGVFDGQPYDVIQRDITYNHLALLPRGGGRQGNDVALRFDAAIIQETTMILHFDGKDFDLSTDDGRKAYDSARQAKQDAAVAEVKKAADVAQAKADAAEAELAPLKAAKVTEARAALEANAKKILPDATFAVGLTDRDVRVKALGAKVDCAGKSDDYVIARFDAAVEAAVVTPAPDPAIEAARLAMQPPTLQGTTPTNVPASWTVAWKKPLTASKDRI